MAGNGQFQGILLFFGGGEMASSRNWRYVKRGTGYGTAFVPIVAESKFLSLSLSLSAVV